MGVCERCDSMGVRGKTVEGRPFDFASYVPQGKQGKKFKVERGKIRRAKRREPFGVNSVTRAGLKVGFNTECAESLSRSLKVKGKRDL